MSLNLRILVPAVCAVMLTLTAAPALAQAGNGKTAETAAQESARPTDELAEAARVVNGPAGNPECVWIGRRVVAALTRDDTENAFRHLELYDRFGCPGPHIQASFRCVIRQGAAEPNAQQALNGRVHACWLNPSAPQASAAAAAPPASTGSASR